MPHILPHQAFITGEVVDPDALNQDFQEIAGKLGGRLNEHDISQDTKTKVSTADEVYYDAHQVVKTVDPGFTRGGGSVFASIDGEGPDPTATIDDTEGWQVIEDDTGSGSLSLDLTTGEDTLVMFAQLQHVGWKGTDTDVAAEIGSPLRLQYAFRVDGAVLDDTITGAVLYPDSPPQQWYRAESANPSGDAFDYRHIQYLQGTTGLSAAVHPTRITRPITVAPGSHVVEVVARRLPPADYTPDNDLEGSTVQVFNRRLFVLRIKGMAKHTGDAATITVSALQDGQVVEAADINANAFGALRSTINALGNAAIERGALRNEHLPSVVYGPRAQPITPASPTTIFNGYYPGYGTDDPAWTTINDGVGVDLLVTGPTAGEWRLDDNPGLFVVIANVEVSSVVWNPQADDIQGILVLALRITNSVGTVTVLGETETYVNTHHPDPENANIMRPICTDIPLMWVVDSTQLAAANRRITQVEVVGAVWDGQNAIPVRIDARTQRGLIYAFALKNVYL